MSGRVVVITGAARGIGAATAAELHRRGARLVLGDLDQAEVERTAATLGDDVVGLPLDVTDFAAFDAFLDAAEERVGPIDVLVNNAGIMPLTRLLDETDENVARVLDLNVRAMMHGTREAARRMVPRGRGHVVNLSSTAGKAGVPGASTYCASKYAMVGFSEAVEAELHGTGVRISCVMPGITRTSLADGVGDLPGFRAITPELVAEAIADVIDKPRFAVWVPRSAAAIVSSPRLMPHRLALWFARRLGTDRVFLDAIDGAERDAYERRVRSG